MFTSSILKYLFISIFSLVINLPTIAVGAAGMGGDDDYDNVIGLITKSYTASTQDQVATITVTRTGTLGALTVDYSVGDNTAITGQDYQTVTGTLSWADTERGDKTFTVPLLSTATLGRMFTVTLSNLAGNGGNMTLGINNATVTITDQSTVIPPPPPTVLIDNFVGLSSRSFKDSRQTGIATITVNRDGILGALAVDYITSNGIAAIAGRDYQTTTGTLSWAANERGDKTFTVPLLAAATVGSRFNVMLSNLRVTNNQAANWSLTIDSAEVTITDDPVVVAPTVDTAVNFATKGYSVTKSAGVVTITVNRPGTQGAMSVNYESLDATAFAGQDYQAVSGTFDWASGESGAKTFTVNLLPTAIGNTSVILLLSRWLEDGSKSVIDTAAVSIIDDTAPVIPPTTGETTTTPDTTTTPSDTTTTTPGTTTPGTSTTPVEPVSTSPIPTGTIGQVLDVGNQVIDNDILVQSTGSLSNAIFAGEVTNQGLIGNSTFLPGSTLTGGSLTGTVNNQGTLSDFNFIGASLSGGTLSGSITNNSKIGGIIHDVTLAPQTTLQGGKVGGTMTLAADSVLKDVQLAPGAEIKGGTLAGTIQGDPKKPATITQATIAPGTKLSYVTLLPPVKIPENVILGPGVILPEDTGILSSNQLNNLDAETFGTLSLETLSLLSALDLEQIPPEALAGLSAEQLAQLSEEALAALSPEQLAEIPPEALAELTAEQVTALSEEAVAAMTGEQLVAIAEESFSGVTAAQMAALSAEALATMTPSQFLYLPPAALSGLTSQNMVGLSPAVISRFTSEHLAALNADQFKQMPNTDVGKWLTNFDSVRMTIDEMTPLVPASWQLNPTTGQLIPPVGTVLAFKQLSTTANLVAPVALPELPDLNTSFGLAGKGEISAKESMQLTLDQVDLSQFIMSQDEQGILQIRGTGDSEGVNFSFIPDSGEMIQVDQDIPVGLEIIEGGFYRMTTPDSQQFKIIPSPRDPAGLSKALGGGAVIIGQRGDVFMEIPSDTRQAGGAREVAMFDPLIESAPEDYCQEIAGETVCDFDQAPPESQPGIRSIPSTGTRVREVPSKKIVYPNGTAQIIRPTVLSPDTLVNLGYTFSNVENVQFNAKGTFIVTHQGNKYLITPNFGPKSRAVGKDEQIEPSAQLNASTGNLTYTITLDEKPVVPAATKSRQVRQDAAREVLEFDSLIEPVPEDSCKEENGEIICE